MINKGLCDADEMESSSTLVDCDQVLTAHHVYEWRNRRKMEERNKKDPCGFCGNFLQHECQLDIIRVFVSSINILVIFQIAMGLGAVYIIRKFRWWCVLDCSLIVSPIVFPLAFSINIDFQRRENIVQELGNMKTAIMVFYLCIKECTVLSGLGISWQDSIRSKLGCFSLSLREYLITEDIHQRRIFLKVIYRDLTTIHNHLWSIPTSKLPGNGPLMSKLIQCYTNICVAFESLQNYREYQSSRAIRAFNKVMVFSFPCLLSPYFVYIGNTSDNSWTAYFVSVVTVFIFSMLQGVHDNLDNPYDGMGEDDVDTNVFEEWVVQILELSRGPKSEANGKAPQVDKEDPLCLFGGKRTTSTTTSACSATTTSTTTSNDITNPNQQPLQKHKHAKTRTSRRLKHTIRNVRTSSITSSKRTSKRGSISNENEIPSNGDRVPPTLPKFRSNGEKSSRRNDAPLPNFRSSRVNDLSQTKSEVFELTITSDIVK